MIRLGGSESSLGAQVILLVLSCSGSLIIIVIHEVNCFLLSEGQLRQIDSDEPFEFEERKDDHKYNQKRYNALGDVSFSGTDKEGI